MAHIESGLKEKFESTGKKPLSTLVTFNGNHEEMAKRLQELGIQPKNSDSKYLGIFSIDLTKNQLSLLETIPEIDSIELDGEATAL